MQKNAGAERIELRPVTLAGVSKSDGSFSSAIENAKSTAVCRLYSPRVGR
jgi:hypothetical protein